MSTDAPMSVLSFSFGPSVQGVAGNFFAALNTGAVISSIISIELDDGTTYLGASTDASSFVGFYSTTSTITSVSISVEADPKFPSLFASVDNLSFAVVPAPGAIAVLGAMGLIVTRRRRS